MAIGLHRTSSQHPLVQPRLWARSSHSWIGSLTRPSMVLSPMCPSLIWHADFRKVPDDIKKVVKQVLEGPRKGILGYTEDQVVIWDFRSDDDSFRLWYSGRHCSEWQLCKVHFLVRQRIQLQQMMVISQPPRSKTTWTITSAVTERKTRALSCWGILSQLSLQHCLSLFLSQTPGRLGGV